MKPTTKDKVNCLSRRVEKTIRRAKKGGERNRVKAQLRKERG